MNDQVKRPLNERVIAAIRYHWSEWAIYTLIVISYFSYFRFQGPNYSSMIFVVIGVPFIMAFRFLRSIYSGVRIGK